MASTASPLRTVPSGTLSSRAVVARLREPADRPRVGLVDARRGNHPAGRALVRSSAGGPTAGGPSAGGPGESLAPVVPLRPAGAVVVPLRGASSVITPATPGDAGRSARLRLTRRGRVVLGGLGVVAALGVAAVVGPALGGSVDPALELAGRSSVVVHSGDTLWSIAESVAPDADPRGVVDALREVNGLSDTGLVPGQVLVLP